MVRVLAPRQEDAALPQAIRPPSDRKRRDRLQVILLTQRGRPRGRMAADALLPRGQPE